MKAIFQPQILLSKEGDGEYTLHAITLVPNTCYGAGPARRGVPAHIRLLPEVIPVILEITHRDGFCLQFVRPVQHCLTDLALGGAQSALTVFAVIDGKVVGASSIDVNHRGRIHVGQGKVKNRPIESTDWYAWENHMPGSEQSLHLQGVVMVPTPGYEVRLEPAAPQGINPRELILDLVIERLDGLWPQVVTRKPVGFSSKGAAGSYDGVLIRSPDAESVHLRIEKVQ